MLFVIQICEKYIVFLEIKNGRWYAIHNRDCDIIKYIFEKH